MATRKKDRIVEQTLDKAVPGKQHVKSMSRALELLQLVSRKNIEGARLAELVTASHLPKATAHRLLSELVASGLLRRESRIYRLGQFAYEIGIAASNSFNLREVCQPSVQRLFDASRGTIYLAMRSGDDCFCVDMKTQVELPWMHEYGPGSRLPLGAGACSLAMLSFLPASERAALIDKGAARLPKAGRAQDRSLGEKVEETRATGYALTASDVVRGFSAVGVPVFDKAGRTVAAISVANHSSQMTREYALRVRLALHCEAARISELLNRRVAAV
jgi:DNA-binding IclR family transcriptional regulator